VQHRHGLAGALAAPGGGDLVMRRETASQTAGPYVHIGLAPKAAGFDIFANNFGNVLVDAKTKGERIRIEGRVFDGIGTVLKDALIEIWQANAAGRYNGPGDPREALALDVDFAGFGRSATCEDGGFRFRTILPGRAPGPGDSLQAAHIAVGVFGRGLIKRLVTRLYLEGEDGHDEDPILALVAPERRATLIAAKVLDAPATYRFDIHLQGEHETVFFDC
jgi:protocatechuate 3,4-dioxygenase alpha subunit